MGIQDTFQPSLWDWPTLWDLPRLCGWFSPVCGIGPLCGICPVCAAGPVCESYTYKNQIHLLFFGLKFQDAVYVRRLERLCDTVVQLDSFVGSDTEKNPVYKEYHGKVWQFATVKDWIFRHQKQCTCTVKVWILRHQTNQIEGSYNTAFWVFLSTICREIKVKNILLKSLLWYYH